MRLLLDSEEFTRDFKAVSADRGVMNDTDMYKVRDRLSFGPGSCSAQV